LLLAQVSGYAKAIADWSETAFVPSLKSNYISGTAIEMDISWRGFLNIASPDGKEITISDTPRSSVQNQSDVSPWIGSIPAGPAILRQMS
jgi:hypothetical protein